MYLCWPAIFTATLVLDLAGPWTVARRPAAPLVVGPVELRLAVCLSRRYDPIARSFGIPIRRVQRTRRDRGGGETQFVVPERRTTNEQRRTLRTSSGCPKTFSLSSSGQI